MGKKQTKRQRKFQATGGVKGRLEKGTITSKTSTNRKRKHTATSSSSHLQDAVTSTASKRLSIQDRSDDITSQENLGDLDIDTFFAQFVQNNKEEFKTHEDYFEIDEDHKQISDENKDETSEGSEGIDGDNDDGSEIDVDVEKEGELKKLNALKAQKGVSVNNINVDDEDSASDEDDDIDAAERRMKSQISKMKQTDPEFHDFLEENEKSLLEFGYEETMKKTEETFEIKEKDCINSDLKEDFKSTSEVDLTPQLLSKLCKGAFRQHGVKSLKKLVSAYRSACHLSDAATAIDKKHQAGESGQSYRIESSKVFDDLMVICLNTCHREFRHHLLDNSCRKKETELEDRNSIMNGKTEVLDDIENVEATPINPKTLEKAELWSDLRPILLSFFRSTLHLLDEAKEPELLSFVLKALAKYLQYLTPFPRVAENALKSLTGLWSAPLDATTDYQVVRVAAFLRIRQLALTQPFPFIEDCLKKTYLAYARRARFGSSVGMATLTFMGNCLIELYSLDFDSSYQHAFVYIRQLALLLRTAFQKKTPEAMQQVYCWQYVHCLKLWVAVLSSAATADDGIMLRSLVYPLTEIILGTMRLVPSPVRHLPMRFHCIRLLQQLAASCQIFIPTTSLLLDCLDWKEWAMAPKRTKTARESRGLQLLCMIKLGKEDPLRTYQQLESAMSDFFLLLRREIELYRYSAGFPEFSVCIVVRLRQFVKENNRNPRFRAYAKACIDLCEKYSKFAVQERAKLHEAPKDIKILECLMPKNEKNMQERHNASIEKEQKELAAIRFSDTPEDQVMVQEDDEEGKKDEISLKPRKKKHLVKANIDRSELHKRLMADDEVMEEKDQVNEGIDWSDED